ncbi:MAG: double-strand break repair helicase AddA [Pseudolabrys sp.]
MSLIVPSRVDEAQRKASDPGVSAWVSANAGSGKTYVLAQRVVRLLLEGTDPAKILCLTFTKAAAANMANRVFAILAGWTALDDAALDREMSKLSRRKPDAVMRARARRLFASALETPGGLKVQTIHAFCTRLLHQFPFEADVAARFEVLDEAGETELLDRMTMAVLLEAAQQQAGPLHDALTLAIETSSDQSFREIVRDAIGKRNAILRWVEHAGSIDSVATQLCGALGIAATDTAETLAREIVEGPYFPSSSWASAAATFRQGSKNDQTQATRLDAASAAGGDAQIDAYCSIFFTKDGPRKSLATKAIREIDPQFCDRLADEASRLESLLAKRRAVACCDRTMALLTLATEVITRYRSEKERRGLLDFDDQIDKSVALLDRTDAAWVHYKLDSGIDHVLIDEAQDTSPRQWQIVTRLVSEFTAGAGARMVNRSIFAVGDDKQSIYSFQGADPRSFSEMKRRFEQQYQNSGLPFETVPLDYSFRSVTTVLQAVDTVFKRPEAHRGLTADPTHTVHTAIRGSSPGLVEIWQTAQPASRADKEGWDAPFDTDAETSPRVQLAQRIARTIKTWRERGEQVGDGAERHVIEPRDIIVLVRNRGPLFEAIIRALKFADIPVAGADRLVLTEHIAIMDLLVLADAILLPDDDLALATALRSPLFGISEQQLYDLAYQRKGTLIAALREKAAQNEAFTAALARYDRLAAVAATHSPYDFFARVLGAERGRRNLLTRLGQEAADPIDEFLNLALDYERRMTPSLQGFVNWIRTASSDVKRDLEMERNEVRVMTVHGAKGLEAPVVFLPDTLSPPAGHPSRQPRLLTLALASAVPDAPSPIVWAPRKDDDDTATAAARVAAQQLAEDEHRRLLYVAMTRAADRLVICGAEGKNKRAPGCWYDLVAEALTPLAVEEAGDDGEPVLRFRHGEMPTGEVRTAPSAAAAADVPAWLIQPAPARTPAIRLVSPSDSDDDDVAPRAGENQDAARKARQRGIVVHRLMQSLPDVPAGTREAAARAYLARACKDWSEEDRAAIAQRVLAILTEPRFVPLFAPGSRAEVAIVGTLPPVRVNGQIDRLAVTDDTVLIGDFKTGRPKAHPPAYIRQLGLYRAVLQRLYPGKAVRAVLIWVDTAEIVEVSAAEMDAAVALVTSA